MPSGAASREQLGDRAVVVVERGVEAELVDEQRDLLRRARAADDRVRRGSLAIWPASEPTAPAAPETKTTSPSLQLGDVEQPDVGGQARHPEHAEVAQCAGAAPVSTARHAPGAERPRARASRRRAARASPSATPVGPRRDDLADRAALQRRAELERRRRRTSRRSSARACTGRPTSTCCGRAPRPSPGSGRSVSTRSKSDGFGSPSGRAASWISRVRCDMAPP